MSSTLQLPRHLTTYAALTLAGAGVVTIGLIVWRERSNHATAKSTLQRTNAVRRPHRAMPHNDVATETTSSLIAQAAPHAMSRIDVAAEDTSPFGAEAPLGTLVLSTSESRIYCKLGIDQLPSLEDIRSVFGPTPDDFRRLVEHIALLTICLACTEAQSIEEEQRLRNLGLTDLMHVLHRRNLDDARPQISELRTLLPSLHEDFIQSTIDQFMGNDTVRVNTHTEPANGAVSDGIPETDMDDDEPPAAEPREGLKGLLFYIAEENARRKAYVHRGISCEECGDNPIRGVRYHCLNCPDFDLCQTCEAQTVHIKTHVFAKIKIPLPVLSQPTKAQPIWYPGDPQETRIRLDAGSHERLMREYRLDRPNIDALYDQFVCTATSVRTQDVNEQEKTVVGIERKAFDLALTSERWPQRHAPSILHDRMFQFYDISNKGIIRFSDFVHGMAYLRGPKRFHPLTRALKGYDLNGDGFVDRADCLRLLRAKYDIQRRLIMDMVEGQEAEQTQAAMATLYKSQPISSMFNVEDIPLGGSRPLRGKHQDTFGDMQPLPGTETILDDADPWSQDDDSRSRHGRQESSSADLRELSQQELSRVEDILYGPVADELHVGTEATPAPVSEVDGLQEPAENPDAITGVSSSIKRSVEALPGHEVLWQIVGDGFNELLDPLFKAKEMQDLEAIEKRDERRRWRKDIDQILAEKLAFQQDLQSAALLDPLMAAAAEAYPKAANVGDKEVSSEVGFEAAFVPTDALTLAEREAEIARRPLEDLLDATGYGTINLTTSNESSTETSSVATTNLGHATCSNPVRSALESDEDHTDPTLPQNKPDVVPSAATKGSNAETMQNCNQPTETKPETPPSSQYLERLGTLDSVDREIEVRGGAGRLSIDELERLVSMDGSRELRGLMASWLEWASF